MTNRYLDLLLALLCCLPSTTAITAFAPLSSRAELITTQLFGKVVHDSDEGYTPRRIVVVGGGIGGLSSAYDARHMLHPKDQVTVVSDRDRFYFTPSNPWIAMGRRTPDEISLDLQEILPKHGIDFCHGRAAHLLPSKNQLRLEDGTRMEYDYLIIATGPKLAFDVVPGLKEHGESVCATPHAVQALAALEVLVQNPGPVVVGATQGASCFGPAYEYALLLKHELKKRGGDKLVGQCPMSFVTSEPVIGHLGLGGAGDSKKILKKILKKNHIKAYPNSELVRVTEDAVMVRKYNEEGKTEGIETIPSALTMMIPPFHGHGVWKSVPGLTDKNGMIKVNENEQSLQYPNIFGVGVCVSLPPPPDVGSIPIGSPKTGYMIESQGTAAVKNILRMIEWEAADHPSKERADLHVTPLLNGICITDFGDDGAVFVTLPQFPPRRLDVTIYNPAVIAAKVAFEKYFLHKIESGDTDPVYEKYMLKFIGVERTKVVFKNKN
jgi:NADPH-dependent 2,4-dienoyl-CoA reductase/sulfur reductase-like enzyme